MGKGKRDTVSGGYTTEDEIRFIMGLSPEMLVRYREVLELRRRWDGLDRDVVIGFLDRLVRRSEVVSELEGFSRGEGL